MNSGKFYFEFDSNVISEYVETINFSIQKMSELKKDIDYLYKKIGLIDFRCINELSFYDNIDKKYREQFKKLKSIFIINSYLEYFSKEFPSKKIQYVNELIKRMMDYNNGIISTRMIEPLNISRWYLYHLLDEKIKLYKALNFCRVFY